MVLSYLSLLPSSANRFAAEQRATVETNGGAARSSRLTVTAASTYQAHGNKTLLTEICHVWLNVRTALPWLCNQNYLTACRYCDTVTRLRHQRASEAAGIATLLPLPTRERKLEPKYTRTTETWTLHREVSWNNYTYNSLRHLYTCSKRWRKSSP
jgi:hypothetical protein